MRTLLRILILLALATLSANAWAQAGNPAGMKAGTPEVAPGKPKPDESNNADRLFARLMTAGGMTEVEAGRIAARRGTTDPAKGLVTAWSRITRERTSA